MANDKDKLETEDTEEELNEGLARGLTLFFVSVVVLISLSLFIFYSTVRARSIGIATGYLKAIEMGYQAGDYKIGKENTDKNFETGIYKVKVFISRAPDLNDSIVIKVEVKDKFFSVTHYKEELKLIPTVDVETEQ